MQITIWKHRMRLVATSLVTHTCEKQEKLSQIVCLFVCLSSLLPSHVCIPCSCVCISGVPWSTVWWFPSTHLLIVGLVSVFEEELPNCAGQRLGTSVNTRRTLYTVLCVCLWLHCKASSTFYFSMYFFTWSKFGYVFCHFQVKNAENIKYKMHHKCHTDQI